MKRNFLILLFLALCCLNSTFAQQIQVTGKVTDAIDKAPIPGVTVTVVGGSTTVMTNGEGVFSIPATVGSVLRFSSISYASQEIKVSSETINVALESQDNTLEQVVVVGFGTQKKEHLTGAISSVNMEQVVGDRPVPDLARGLQGAVPGLSVMVPSGEVGSDAILKIRGQIGSIQGNNNPLILVDNVEIPSLQYINPNDIASVT